MTDPRVLKTIIAEAGGNPAGMAAVAAIINNRAQQTGMTPLQVVQQRGQFEGYSNPGPVIARQLNDPKLLSRAEQAYNGVASGAIPDPTNGGTQFRAANATRGMPAPHGTINIGGNVFARGSGQPQTALAAINSIVPPNPQSRPTALAYAPPASVRAISVQPNGSPASLGDALAAKFGSSTVTAPGASDLSVTGIRRPAQTQTASIVPQQLISHPVQTVRIDPMTGNPVGTNSAPDLQTALNTYAQREALNRPQPSIVPQAKVTGGDNVFSTPPPTPFQQNNQNVLSFLSSLTGAGSSGSSAMRAIAALQAQPQPVQTINNAFGGASASGSAYQTGSPTMAQRAAINAAPVVSHTAVPNQTRIGPTPSPLLAFNGDQNTGIPAPGVNAINTAAPKPGQIFTANDGTKYQYVQMTGGVNGTGNASYQWARVGNSGSDPFGGSTASIGGGSSNIVPRSYTPSPGLRPLTSFNTVNPTSQILPGIASQFNSSPAGHITSLLRGEPIQGGLLGMLFNHSSAPVSQSLAQAMAPSSPLVAQQSADQRGIPALQASGMINNFGMLTGSNEPGSWH